jgi:hypothetical protein
MPGPNPYQYQIGPADDPITVASQFGVTPQQLLAANPGGTPFVTGQTVNVPPQSGPYQYSAPIGPVKPKTTNFFGGVGNRPYAPQPFQQAPPLVNMGVPPTIAAGRTGNGSFYSPVYGTDDSWATGTATATAPGAQPRPQPQTAPGMPISDNNYMTNPALYSLQWNSSAKNVKNRFNTNLKWAQNAWRRKAGRGMNARRRQEEQQRRQDFTLSNSLIHLGAGSG